MAAKKSILDKVDMDKSKKKAADRSAKNVAKAGKKSSGKTGKAAKAVKESFRFPAEDYALFVPLKARAKLGGRPAKKAELVCVALRVLLTLDDSVLIEQLRQLDAKSRR